ncbi:MAG: serine/threonine protein kinase, partial [Bradymonadaceae bacterium]
MVRHIADLQGLNKWLREIILLTDLAGEILNERFEILRILGEGGQGRTYLARDVQEDQQVVVKELVLHDAADWKAIELFEREGKILRNLDHPAIPAYRESFHLDDGARFFLVQDYVAGEPLSVLVASGHLMKEEQARRFLDEMLDIFDYLHGLSPPVIHRDIKPSNIIERPDGSFVLVDFGAVQAVSPDTIGGSTIVGTTGYMPPEQLMGQATPATDIYALGATLVHLLGGMHPANLPMHRMKLKFQDLVFVSPELEAVLEAMLEPSVEQRLSTPAMVRGALLGQRSAPDTGPSKPSKPSKPASTEPGMDRVRELLESNPAQDPWTRAVLEDNALIVETRPTSPNAFPWAGLSVFGLGWALFFIGCAANLEGVCCLGSMLIFIVAPAVYFLLQTKNGELQRLKIAPEGIELFEILSGKGDTESYRSKARIELGAL